MSTHIRVHLRSNVIGYVAIFLFAVGGTAYATHPGGANTISSGDIINGEVKSDDIGLNSIGSGKITDKQVKNQDLSLGASSSNTIADGGIQNVDVANDTLTGAKVDEATLFNDNSLNGADVADGGLSGDDVADGSLTDADTSGLVPYGDILWAVVNSDGTLARASNATTTSSLQAAGSGNYEVAFGNGGLDPCASIAQISSAGFPFTGSPGQAATAQGEGLSGAPNIDVRTFDDAGTPADRAFTVFVLCPEGPGGAAVAKSADRGQR